MDQINRVASANVLPVSTCWVIVDYIEGSVNVEATREWARELLSLGWSAGSLATLSNVYGDDWATAAASMPEAFTAIGIKDSSKIGLLRTVRSLLIDSIVDGRIDSRDGLRLGGMYSAAFAGSEAAGLFDIFSVLEDRISAIENRKEIDNDYDRLGHWSWTVARLDCLAAIAYPPVNGMVGRTVYVSRRFLELLPIVLGAVMVVVLVATFLFR